MSEKIIYHTNYLMMNARVNNEKLFEWTHGARPKSCVHEQMQPLVFNVSV